LGKYHLTHIEYSSLQRYAQIYSQLSLIFEWYLHVGVEERRVYVATLILLAFFMINSFQQFSSRFSCKGKVYMEN